MKKLLSIALCAVLALSALCAPAAAYSDVDAAAWYAPAVDYCTEQGLMNGVGDGVFDPEGPVTRAQMATTLWRLAGKPAAAAPENFADVASDAWYAEAVLWAAERGVTDGVGGKLFAPDDALTREQLVTFFYRFAGKPAAAGEGFADQAEISGWAQDAALWARSAGLMQGRGEGRFVPAAGVTRAELAQVLKNYAGTAEPGERRMPANSAPTDAVRDSDGALLVTDSYYKVVWRVTEDDCTVFAGYITLTDAGEEPYGGYLDAEAEKALFASPWAIAPFLGGWAVSDPDNNTVRLIQDGVVQTLNGIDFKMPTGLAAGADGLLYVANTEAGTIIEVTPEGDSSVVWSGLEGPTGLAWAKGALYVAETDAGNVWRLDGDGTKTLVSGDFFGPTGLAVGADGTVYVSDTAGAAVYAVSPGGTQRVILERAAGQTMELWPAAPAGLALGQGVLTVCDRFAGVLIALAA